MLSRSRRGLLALLVCGSALLLAACGTSFGAQTNQLYESGIGSNHRFGDVEILNAVFVDNGDGTATLSAGLISKLDGGDTLTGVSATDDGGSDIAATLTEPVTLPKDELVSLGTKPEVVLPDGGFQAGYLVHLTLTFENAAPIQIDAPVDSRSKMYDSIATPAPPKSTSQSKSKTNAESKSAESQQPDSGESGSPSTP